MACTTRKRDAKCTSAFSNSWIGTCRRRVQHRLSTRGAPMNRWTRRTVMQATLAGIASAAMADTSLDAQLLVRPPRDELLEFDIAVSRGVGRFEVQQQFFLGNVAVDGLEQHVELRMIEKAVAVEIARVEDPAGVCDDVVIQCGHERLSCP